MGDFQRHIPIEIAELDHRLTELVATIRAARISHSRALLRARYRLAKAIEREIHELEQETVRVNAERFRFLTSGRIDGK